MSVKQIGTTYEPEYEETLLTESRGPLPSCHGERCGFIANGYTAASNESGIRIVLVAFLAAVLLQSFLKSSIASLIGLALSL